MSKTLYEDIYAGTNIVSGEEYREMISTISQLASDTVVKTLGPYGSTTIIDDGSGFTYPTKDGWSTLNKLRFNDPIYNTIFNLLKQISFNSVNTVGDGTTTAMVAANAFLQLLNNWETPEGFRQADFIKAVEEVADTIEKTMLNSDRIRQIDQDGNFDDIYNIAYTATNGNEKFARIIQTIYLETKNPNIHVAIDAKNSETRYEIQEGYKFDCSTLNFNVYINEGNGTCKRNNMRTIIFDHNITYNDHKEIITALSSLASVRKMDIIIMAPYFDDIISTMIDSLIQRMMTQGQIPNIMLMQIPNTMNIHQQILSDLGLLTNAPIFDSGRLRAFKVLHHNQTHGAEDQIEDDILQMDMYKFNNPQEIIDSCLGIVKTIVVDKSHAFIQDYMDVVNKTKYDAVLREVTEQYEHMKKTAAKTINGHLDKDFMTVHARYTKLVGKTGVIYVGGLSDLQRRCDKDAIDDATLVCKSAFENGYIRGLNMEMLTCIHEAKTTDDVNSENYELRKVAYEFLYGAFIEVTQAVIENKFGKNTAYIDIIGKCINQDKGYNLVTEEFSDLDNLTVINSVATDLEILRAIVNILTTIMTSNQFLSMNKSYDRTMSHDQQLNRLIEDKRATTKAITEAVIDTLLSNETIVKIIAAQANQIVKDKTYSFNEDEEADHPIINTLVNRQPKGLTSINSSDYPELGETRATFDFGIFPELKKVIEKASDIKPTCPKEDVITVMKSPYGKSGLDYDNGIKPAEDAERMPKEYATKINDNSETAKVDVITSDVNTSIDGKIEKDFKEIAERVILDIVKEITR